MPTAVVIASCALVLVFQKYREMLNTWSNVQSMPQPFHSTCKYTVYTIRFADDIKTFRLIMNRDDQNIVQQDITVMETLVKIGCSNFTQTNVHIWTLKKKNLGENQYYTTMNNVTKTIDRPDKQKDLGVTFDSNLHLTNI